MSAIAGQLNARKVTTANGGRWTHVQVGQILDRAAGSTTHQKLKGQRWRKCLHECGIYVPAALASRYEILIYQSGCGKLFLHQEWG